MFGKGELIEFAHLLRYPPEQRQLYMDGVEHGICICPCAGGEAKYWFLNVIQNHRRYLDDEKRFCEMAGLEAAVEAAETED